MESKLNHEMLRRCISAVLKASARKRRRFPESVELQVAFKDYHLLGDKCIEGAVVLKHIPKPDMRVCVLGDAGHSEEARANGLPLKTSEGLRELDRCSSDVYRQIRARAIISDFDAFVASPSVLEMLELSPVGVVFKTGDKWPKLLSHHEPLVEQVDKVKATVAFRLRGVPSQGLVVGKVSMTAEQLAENVDDVVRHVAFALREDWDMVRSVHIKSTMGPPQRIY